MVTGTTPSFHNGEKNNQLILTRDLSLSVRDSVLQPYKAIFSLLFATSKPRRCQL